MDHVCSMTHDHALGHLEQQLERPLAAEAQEADEPAPWRVWKFHFLRKDAAARHARCEVRGERVSGERVPPPLRMSGRALRGRHQSHDLQGARPA